MKNKIKGGLETVIAIVIVVGLVAALLLSVVVPMSQEGDELIGKTTDSLVKQSKTIEPQID